MSEVKQSGITPERRKRINRLKKIIVYTVFMMILLPSAGCILLGVALHKTKDSIETMSMEMKSMETFLQKSVDEADRAEALLEINEEIRRGSEAESQTDIMVTGSQQNAASEETSGNRIEEGEIREVYLTFDDGPSIYTNRILDILAEYNVKASFFVTGKGKEGYGDTYRRIVEEGHTLGMHSYSHEYANIYASLLDFQQDMQKLRDFLYAETGVASKYYRFPGGSSNRISGKDDMQDMIDYLNAMDITYFDWNISAGDANSTSVGSDEIVDRVMAELPSHRVAVILMHDAADKYSTVEALPKLIESIQGLDDRTVILPITEETMLIQHVQSNKEKNTEDN